MSKIFTLQFATPPKFSSHGKARDKNCPGPTFRFWKINFWTILLLQNLNDFQHVLQINFYLFHFHNRFQVILNYFIRKNSMKRRFWCQFFNFAKISNFWELKLPFLLKIVITSIKTFFHKNSFFIHPAFQQSCQRIPKPQLA